MRELCRKVLGEDSKHMQWPGDQQSRLLLLMKEADRNATKVPDVVSARCAGCGTVLIGPCHMVCMMVCVLHVQLSLVSNHLGPLLGRESGNSALVRAVAQ